MQLMGIYSIISSQPRSCDCLKWDDSAAEQLFFRTSETNNLDVLVQLYSIFLLYCNMQVVQRAHTIATMSDHQTY